MKKNDILTIILLVLVGIGLTILIYIPHGTTGDYVEIKENGKILKTLPLDTDTTYTIQTAYGSNVLQIKDSVASIIKADCKNQVCVYERSISTNGETIVCLPHQLVIEVRSNEDSGIDAIVS